MKKIIKFVLSLILLFGFITLFNCSYAASASIRASKTSITTQETATITVAVGSSEAWNVRISASGGTLSGTTTQADAAESEVSKDIFTATFKATTAGTYIINLSGEVTGSDLVKKSISGSVTITVTNPSSDGENEGGNTGGGTTVKSSNANLSSLSVTPTGSGLSPKFSASTTTYNMSVENNVTKVTIKAAAAHSAAKVTGTGAYNLDEGTKAIYVKVTAEDGTTKTYTIKVNRKASNPDTTPNVIDEQDPEQEEVPQALRLNVLNVTEGLILSPEFSMEVFLYQVDLNEELDKINISAIANIEGATIEVLGNENLKFGENIITILLSMDGYETVTYQIVVNKTVGEEKEDEVIEEIIDTLADNAKQLKMRAWIIIGLTIVTCAAGIVFAIIEYKYQKEKKESDVVEVTPLGSKKEKSIEKQTEELEEDQEEKKSKEDKKGRGKHF